MKKMKQNTHIKKLSDFKNIGLSTFLIVGLSGCDLDKNCNDDNMKYLSQKEQLECKNKKTNNTNTSGSTTGSNARSGFFAFPVSSDSSSNHSSSGG